MFSRIVFSALGAGLAVCLVVSVIQYFTTEPLILHAEVFEKADMASAHAQPAAAGSGETAMASEHEHGDAWQPADGFERTAYTVLANLLVGIAVALMILAAMVLKGEPIDAMRGLLWGVAGFAAASLLPSLGLPPELPGTPAADLLPRQLWWLATAFASAAGIGLLVFGRHWLAWAGGIVLLVLPHLIGAPAPPSLDTSYPAAMAGEFVVASLAVSAILWSLAGLVGGFIHARLGRAS
jgi:cobalt transporter subunit CbtA